jgi:hypothetical protein
MAKQKVIGPYKVINIGVGGNVYEVVEIVDAQGNRSELRPPYRTRSRQAAQGKKLRLNKKWQQEFCMEDNYPELVKRFS